ncbi:M67 family metallopeptidase [Calothrix sp. UHCC 0171]|nr:M67 family metallopeptidase [Calothrix sp. UHCC 0171]MEA5571145.1 M67 family metallopeptidase [Calothrix sp. UHCC 0171]
MDVVIYLLPEHLHVIYTHAESIYPEECCGILLGEISSSGKKTVQIITTENAWIPETPGDFGKERRYAIAPQVMLQIQKQARDESLNIIGIFHSHPDYPAIPSECDRAQAWQEYSYIIVSVDKGKVIEVKSWCLDENHQFQSEEIAIVEDE